MFLLNEELQSLTFLVHHYFLLQVLFETCCIIFYIFQSVSVSEVVASVCVAVVVVDTKQLHNGLYLYSR